MICPYRHVGFITELDDAELFEFEKATTLAMKVMETVSHPDGYNIGITFMARVVAFSNSNNSASSSSVMNPT